MTNEEAFRTVVGDAECEIEEKRSRFIAAVRHVTETDEADAFVKERRRAHPSARHTVYAYCLRNGAVRYGDDGEPQGTAGQPTLEMIRSAGLSDICVVTTRYFGGILLGTGGLSRAYGGAARAALESAEVAEYISFEAFSVVCGYADYRRLLQELPRFAGRETGTEFAEFVTLACLVPRTEAQAFAARVTDVTAGRCVAITKGVLFERR